MITLCVETATARTGVALTRDSHLVAESLFDTPGGRQNRLLMPDLQRLLQECGVTADQIDLFACSNGPGSFTGIRTGIAAIQALALAHNKPCVGVSTLAMLAMNLSFAALAVCPMLDARKSEVYTALYQVSDAPQPLLPDTVIAPTDFLSQLDQPTLFVGDGAVRYRDLIQETLGDKAHFAPGPLQVVRASAGCLLAESLHQRGCSLQPEKLLPTYLRLSEAELSRQQKI